ncbi:glycerophosphodiester phosphodiesterase [Treponema phagedenis]|uniref:glycerophosphodiester phosphodiesterase n=1 Tax=Treponema phagedenis TaxID=162 RepID=A0A0B7GSJ1_TREPH|nr:glycerophosphodiester phosphodiesterase [Treponema phagedenis]QSI00039.1 glycerophosphodiester phosphodiesterase [Treponema phagedenis]CEM61443.1 periplasmic glycerophosphodiester phosphodiesterase [Treponema phagedenis]
MYKRFVIVMAFLAATAAMFAGGGKEKIVIAHRGASGYLPEHTLESKTLAFAQGADYLGQDLAMSKDNQLIVIHDHYLDNLTDVAKKFPTRARADGRYYVIDFTLDELRQLNVTEVFQEKDGIQKAVYSDRFPLWNSTFKLHTFEEEIEFIQGLEKSTGKKIGIYPELKAPWFHHKEGKDISVAALTALKKYGYTKETDPVYLQTFDYNELKRIKTELLPQFGMDLKLILLLSLTEWEKTQEKDSAGNWVNYDYDWMFRAGAMQEIKKYADGVGPWIYMLIDDVHSSADAVKLSPLVDDIRDAKLECHVYTIRKEDVPDYMKDVNELLKILFKKAKITGVFTDFPDIGVKFLGKKARF